MQLLARLLQIRGQLKPLWQQARHPHERAHIGHVTINAGGHTGILHLDRQIAAILQARFVHLTDTGRRNRAHIKPLKPLQPALGPVPCQHLFELRRRHERRICAQPPEDLRQLRRQHIAGVHRHQLPDFHGCAAHLRKLVGDAAHIRRR